MQRHAIDQQTLDEYRRHVYGEQLDVDPSSNLRFYHLSRLSAITNDETDAVGTILPQSVEEVLLYGANDLTKEGVILHILRTLNQCQQLSGHIEYAIISNEFRQARDFRAVLGTTLWELILDSISTAEGGLNCYLEFMNSDDNYETYTVKPEILRSYLESACFQLQHEGKDVTFYNVFAEFLNILELGIWKIDGLFETIAVKCPEYKCSCMGKMKIDERSAYLFPKYVLY
jgi:hypothetical protein